MKKLTITALLAALSLICSSCGEDILFPSVRGDRFDHVFIMMGLGNNNLSSDISSNILSIENAPLPLREGKNAVVVYKHLKGNAPVLMRLSSDWDGTLLRDTLGVWPEGTISNTSETIHDVLETVKTRVPSKSYSLLLSSHGTGWLPQGYYEKSSSFSPQSFGAEKVDGKNHELSIQELASSIPLHLDCIIMDACLMGGVETAYELRRTTDRIIFSPAEVLEQGMSYSVITESLIGRDGFNAELFCKEYIEMYLKYEDNFNRSAIISYVDCTCLEQLAGVCRDLFEKYRSGMSVLNGNDVQRFFRKGKNWFYDLEDILVKAGMSEQDKARLDEVLDKCILYKNDTGQLFGEIEVESFCGLSMYLPSAGDSFLNGYYTSLSWNEATSLVK